MQVQNCWSQLFQYNVSPDCKLQILSYIINGYVMIVSPLYKIPQLRRIEKIKSAKQFTLTQVFLEFVTGLLSCGYYYYFNFPFKNYIGQVVGLLVQYQMIRKVYQYDHPPKKQYYFYQFIIFLSLFLYGIRIIPQFVVVLLLSYSSITYAFAKSILIKKIYTQKDSSSLSQFTCLISLSLILTKMAAVFQNQQVDYFLVANFTMQALFSILILFFSIFYNKKVNKVKSNQFPKSIYTKQFKFENGKLYLKLRKKLVGITRNNQSIQN